MATPRPPAAHLQTTPDDVEAQFYEALREADIGKLMAVWSDDDDIVCVHPGGPRVIGTRAIRASFEAIFERGGIPVQPGSVHRPAWRGLARSDLEKSARVSHLRPP